MITENVSSNTSVECRRIISKKPRRRWSQREKRILLSVMKKSGHSNIDKFVEVLPLKSKYQISRYLNKTEKIASIKLKNRYSKMQYTLQRIHQWISLLNVNPNTDSVVHKNLPAFILPIVEKYGLHSSKTTEDFDIINFESAYRFIFDSLRNFPANSSHISDEVKALLFSCFDQINDEIKCNKNEANKTLHTSVSRLINQQNNTIESKVVSGERNIFSMFEINSFHWTNEEIKILCQMKS